jgi:hypothetical protein
MNIVRLLLFSGLSSLLFAIYLGHGYPALNHYNPRRFPG